MNLKVEIIRYEIETAIHYGMVILVCQGRRMIWALKVLILYFIIGEIRIEIRIGSLS